jgi:hypothetical protein
MNERIKELHNRACRLDMEQYPNAIPDGERIQQKFAELIVRECAAYLNSAMEVYTQSEQDLYDRGATKIKQQFGVE